MSLLSLYVFIVSFCFPKILNEIAQHKIKIYEFPEVEEEEESKMHKVLRDRVPFAVVGANTVVEHDGKKVRGRKYPWGIAEGNLILTVKINSYDFIDKCSP